MYSQRRWCFHYFGLLTKTLYIKVIACLDVRTNDMGDLVVTKGDQYDVREHTKENEVREIILIVLIIFMVFLGFL